MICPDCGQHNKDNSTFCVICGAQLVQADVFRADSRSQGAAAPLPSKKETAKVLRDGRYEILEKLGEGGMGRIYLSRDVKMDYKVVIKELLPIFVTREEREYVTKRFTEEAKILFRLDFRGLPKVIDYFQDKSNMYIVMQYIEGDNLSVLVKKRPDHRISVDEAVLWMFDLLNIIKYLHNQNPPIIHRDIKPKNIMMNKRGELYLVDFGLARTIGMHTHTGTSVGTYGYSSPEHYSGKFELSSDLFSLGATFHHLLSADDPQNRDTFDYPPLEKYDPSFPPKLQKIFDKLLDVRKSQRYQRVEFVLEALEEFKKEYEREKAKKLMEALPSTEQFYKEDHGEKVIRSSIQPVKAADISSLAEITRESKLKLKSMPEKPPIPLDLEVLPEVPHKVHVNKPVDGDTPVSLVNIKKAQKVTIDSEGRELSPETDDSQYLDPAFTQDKLSNIEKTDPDTPVLGKSKSSTSLKETHIPRAALSLPENEKKQPAVEITPQIKPSSESKTRFVPDSRKTTFKANIEETRTKAEEQPKSKNVLQDLVNSKNVAKEKPYRESSQFRKTLQDLYQETVEPAQETPQIKEPVSPKIEKPPAKAVETPKPIETKPPVKSVPEKPPASSEKTTEAPNKVVIEEKKAEVKPQQVLSPNLSQPDKKEAAAPPVKDKPVKTAEPAPVKESPASVSSPSATHQKEIIKDVKIELKPAEPPRQAAVTPKPVSIPAVSSQKDVKEVSIKKEVSSKPAESAEKSKPKEEMPVQKPVSVDKSSQKAQKPQLKTPDKAAAKLSGAVKEVKQSKEVKQDKDVKKKVIDSPKPDVLKPASVSTSPAKAEKTAPTTPPITGEPVETSAVSERAPDISISGKPAKSPVKMLLIPVIIILVLLAAVFGRGLFNRETPGPLPDSGDPSTPIAVETTIPDQDPASPVETAEQPVTPADPPPPGPVITKGVMKVPAGMEFDQIIIYGAAGEITRDKKPGQDLVIGLDPGSYTVKLVRAGYYSLTLPEKVSLLAEMEEDASKWNLDWVKKPSIQITADQQAKVTLFDRAAGAVIIENKEMTTDGDKFTLLLEDLEDRPYKLSAQKEGFVEESVELTLTKGKTEAVSFNMAEKPNLVISANVDANIILIKEDGERKRILDGVPAGASGDRFKVTAENLEPGQYSITAVRSGYNDKRETLKLEKGKNQEVTINLERYVAPAPRPAEPVYQPPRQEYRPPPPPRDPVTGR